MWCQEATPRSAPRCPDSGDGRMIGSGNVDIAHDDKVPTPSKNSALPTGGVRVGGRASALLGGAGRSLASHRLPLDGGPTYFGRTPSESS